MSTARDDQRLSALRKPVHDVMSVPVIFADVEATLRTLAVTMAEEGVGAVVLLGRDGPTSIVTERDLVEAIADGQDLDDTWAVEVAAHELDTVAPDDQVTDAALAMVRSDVRHIPVRAYGSVVGMISARDVLRILVLGH